MGTKDTILCSQLIKHLQMHLHTILYYTMEYWHKATDRQELPHCQRSKAAQFGAFVKMYLQLPIKDQVCILS